MKIIKISVNKQNQGLIVFQPEVEEDLWYLYSLILVGDLIKTSVKRKVKKDYGLGMFKTEIRWLNLTMQVLKIDYECDVRSELHIKAKNFEENQYIKKGQY